MSLATFNRLEIVNLLLEVGRPLILTEYRADSCIASCRIGLNVLNYFGFEANAEAVSLFVANRKLWKRMDRPNPPRSFQPMRAGEWSVGVGFGYDPGRADQATGFNGHLVLVLPDRDGREIIVDLSLDQCSRPHRAINVGPAAHSVPAIWRTNPIALKVNDATCIYQGITNTHYLNSPDWIPVSPTEHIRRMLSEEIIQAILRHMS